MVWILLIFNLIFSYLLFFEFALIWLLILIHDSSLLLLLGLDCLHALALQHLPEVDFRLQQFQVLFVQLVLFHCVLGDVGNLLGEHLHNLPALRPHLADPANALHIEVLFGQLDIFFPHFPDLVRVVALLQLRMLGQQLFPELGSAANQFRELSLQLFLRDAFAFQPGQEYGQDGCFHVLAIELEDLLNSGNEILAGNWSNGHFLFLQHFEFMGENEDLAVQGTGRGALCFHVLGLLPLIMSIAFRRNI